MNVLILVVVWSKVCIVLYCLKTVVRVLNGASELFAFLQFFGLIVMTNKIQLCRTIYYSIVPWLLDMFQAILLLIIRSF